MIDKQRIVAIVILFIVFPVILLISGETKAYGEEYNVDSIFYSKDKSFISINGHIYHVNDSFHDGMITEISRNEFTIKFQGVEKRFHIGRMALGDLPDSSQAKGLEHEPTGQKVVPYKNWGVEQERGARVTNDTIKISSPINKDAGNFKCSLPNNILNSPLLKLPLAGSYFTGAIWLILSWLGYIYYSFFLQFVAKKARVEPAWLAWIPVINIFLECKVAGMSYKWLLPILLPFILILAPCATIILVLPFLFWIIIFPVLRFYRMAVAVNKPGWVGLGMFVPFLNLGTMWYLAFTKSDWGSDESDLIAKKSGERKFLSFAIIYLVILVIVICGLGIWFIGNKEKFLNDIKVYHEKVIVQGSEFALTTNSQGCLDEAFSRMQVYKDENVFSQIANVDFLKSCFSKASYSSGFCDGVPKRVEGERGYWAMQQCTGKSDYQDCIILKGAVQDFCFSRK